MLGLMFDAQGSSDLGQQHPFALEMPLHGFFQPGEVKGKFKPTAVHRPQPKVSDNRMIGIDVRVTQAVAAINKRSAHPDGSAANICTLSYDNESGRGNPIKEIYID